MEWKMELIIFSVFFILFSFGIISTAFMFAHDTERNVKLGKKRSSIILNKLKKLDF